MLLIINVLVSRLASEADGIVMLGYFLSSGAANRSEPRIWLAPSLHEAGSTKTTAFAR